MSDSTERPSPFTVRQPNIQFSEEPQADVEGPQAAPPPSITVGGLIEDLTTFADFYEQYEQASADMQIDIALHGWQRSWDLQQQILATAAIDRVRAYVLARHGAELTIGTARRLLGDLIREGGVTIEEAEELSLETAMDLLQRGGLAVKPSEQPAADSARHSEDFTSVLWFSHSHSFTPTQAKCVAVLWAAWENGTPDLQQVTILDRAGSAMADKQKPSLAKLFAGHKAWGTMIVCTPDVRGAYRLAPPSSE